MVFFVKMISRKKGPNHFFYQCFIDHFIFFFRFLQNSDHSLAITRLKEEDSGTYTCMAETDLDFDEAKAILIVQDVPNPPFLQWVTCRPTDADVVWRPSENNKAPITSFTIERSTSFAPDQWEKATGNKPSLFYFRDQHYLLLLWQISTSRYEMKVLNS